eukprot:363539-Chlamydomonas_euryale.AAC.4
MEYDGGHAVAVVVDPRGVGGAVSADRDTELHGWFVRRRASGLTPATHCAGLYQQDLNGAENSALTGEADLKTRKSRNELRLAGADFERIGRELRLAGADFGGGPPAGPLLGASPGAGGQSV